MSLPVKFEADLGELDLRTCGACDAHQRTGVVAAVEGIDRVPDGGFDVEVAVPVADRHFREDRLNRITRLQIRQATLDERDDQLLRCVIVIPEKVDPSDRHAMGHMQLRPRIREPSITITPPFTTARDGPLRYSTVSATGWKLKPVAVTHASPVACGPDRPWPERCPGRGGASMRTCRNTLVAPAG